MDEPAFSDFGARQPSPGTRKRSRAAVASMVIGLLGPFTCLGGVVMTASALGSVSYRSAVGAMVLPIALSLSGLFLGAFAFFVIALRPDRVRGSGYAGVGLALNILGAAMNILMATQVVRLGRMATGTTLDAIRTIDEGDADKIDAVFHESVRDELTGERLDRFRTRVRASFGDLDLAHGAQSVGELLTIRWPDAARVVRQTKGDADLPATPIWFETSNALVVLSLHKDVASQLISMGITLESLVTDIQVIGEDGEIIRLMSP